MSNHAQKLANHCNPTEYARAVVQTVHKNYQIIVTQQSMLELLFMQLPGYSSSKMQGPGLGYLLGHHVR